VLNKGLDNLVITLEYELRKVLTGSFKAHNRRESCDLLSKYDLGNECVEKNGTYSVAGKGINY